MLTYLIFLVTGMAAGLVIGHLWGHGKAVAQRNAILLAKAEAETTHARDSRTAC